MQLKNRVSSRPMPRGIHINQDIQKYTTINQSTNIINIRRPIVANTWSDGPVFGSLKRWWNSEFAESTAIGKGWIYIYNDHDVNKRHTRTSKVTSNWSLCLWPLTGLFLTSSWEIKFTLKLLVQPIQKNIWFREHPSTARLCCVVATEVWRLRGTQFRCFFGFRVSSGYLSGEL